MDMQFNFAYGNSAIPMTVKAAKIDVLESVTPAPLADLPEAFRRAVEEDAIGSAPLKDVITADDQVTVVISDITRGYMHQERICPLLLDYLHDVCGVAYENIVYLVAVGTHRAQTEAEFARIASPYVAEKVRILNHDCDGELIPIGVTSRGTEVEVNPLVVGRKVILLGGTVHHFFAGYGGGRKSILPGVAGRRTVLYNHNAMFIHSEKSRQGNLSGNPIHEDMAFAAKTAKLGFILNVLLDGDKRIIAAFAGDSVKAHEAACALCLKQTSVPAVAADIVVTSNGGYPLDQNVYQCVKGLTAAEACVHEGGVIILSAGLGDGHGGEAFYHWFADRNNADEVMRDIVNVPADKTHMDQWQAQILARVQQKAFCIFVAAEENRQLLEDMHMGWAPTLDAALDMATARMGKSSTVTVIPDGVGVIVTPNK